jgi:glycosyltransferase involved in cell wall biosynthesis
VALRHNAPYIFTAAREIAGHLRRLDAAILCCSGYKPDIIGWLAARRAGVPVVAVAHGWTSATLKVRLNEGLDRLVLRRMDCTVCVSQAQAVKVRRAGVPARKLCVIRNAVHPSSMCAADPAAREALRGMFRRPPGRIVGAAGRLSPEKGFDQLVEAAALVRRRAPDIGFVLFGDGPQRDSLARLITSRGLEGAFLLAGFRTDLDRFLHAWDLAVLPSHTEGLPVIVLEAMAAAVPVVATAVGGTPEVVEEGVTGYLVPDRNPAALADRILAVLRDEPARVALGLRGRERVRDRFTFSAQSHAYSRLFERLTTGRQGKTPPAHTNLPGACSQSTIPDSVNTAHVVA